MHLSWAPDGRGQLGLNVPRIAQLHMGSMALGNEEGDPSLYDLLQLHVKKLIYKHQGKAALSIAGEHRIKT